MQFLRILLLPILSILLVSGNLTLGNLYSYPLGVSSVVKNNAKTDVGTEMGVRRWGGFGNQLNNTPIKIKPSGLGSTGRTIPKNLNEQLAMKEVMADPQAIGELCDNVGPLKDIRWRGWFKMRNKNSNGVEIHFNAKWESDKIVAVDDFKFIDP